jgi:hypothetical protein
LVLADPGVNPDTIFIGLGGEQLVQERNFKAIGQKPACLELPQEFLDVVPRGDDHDDRLHGRIAVREKFEAPDDLRDGEGRKLLQLQVDHGARLFKVTFREVDDAQERTVGRQPCDIELGLEEGLPILAD